MEAFTAAPAGTVNINVSGSSQRVSLGVSPSIEKVQVRIMNNGTATVWVNFGDVTVTATTTTSFPVGPGVTEVLSVSSVGGALYASAIAAGATGIIYFTPGEGI